MRNNLFDLRLEWSIVVDAQNMGRRVGAINRVYPIQRRDTSPDNDNARIRLDEQAERNLAQRPHHCLSYGAGLCTR